MADDHEKNDRPRLIERAFPLKQASIDSVHEKNVRHGHISTLHIWPARRPLAACRAALIATLLPDPGTPEERKRLCEKIAGTVVKTVKKKKVNGKTVEELKEETVGGILHWGRESSPDLEWFRKEIRKAYGGRAPRVLDPFAGGGAIPLEAMRLGCEVTAIDINPVAWFILKCTLEYPQRLTGQTLPLPSFILKNAEFMEAFFKAKGYKGRGVREALAKVGLEKSEAPDLKGMGAGKPELQADLAWQVRSWGAWVLERAKKDLERFYPTIDGKPTVAYLWARTVKCKNCRAEIPLLKTRWLCKKEGKRVLLTLKPKRDKNGVEFAIQESVPVAGANAAQRREHDKKVGQGTMSRSGAWCPVCGQPGTVAMDLEDIRQECIAGREGQQMTAVIVEGIEHKEYRPPTKDELKAAMVTDEQVSAPYSKLGVRVPHEPLPHNPRLLWAALYGLTSFDKLFTRRQLYSLGIFLESTTQAVLSMKKASYAETQIEAVVGYLALAIDRLADRGSSIASWDQGRETIRNTFVRFGIPMVWDFCECNPLSGATGNFMGAVEWVALVAEHAMNAAKNSAAPMVLRGTAAHLPKNQRADVIVTDPPYYDAVPYSDIASFFYVWLRRLLQSRFPSEFASEALTREGETVMDRPHQDLRNPRTKDYYEQGMREAFDAMHKALGDDGQLVIVFAHKEPDAWETLVSAMIRTGFVVTASWPITTEMSNRSTAIKTASLSSSVWLVCKKRPEAARPGWDNRVLDEMRQNIYERLHEYWDADIHGPDFVWAATGPALEAYSKHPVVKKANEPGKAMEVSEFLRAVRRIVVDFVVGRVLTKGADDTTVSGLDDVTTYYLLHRNDFRLEDAPIGPCILYAVSCGLSDSALADQHEILIRTGGKEQAEEGEEETSEDGEVEEGTGSTVKLRPWQQRKRKNLGYDADGRPAPLIDQVHRLMQLWKAGDVVKVDDYLDERALRKNTMFQKLLQALIELAPPGSDERSILEIMSKHVAARGVAPERERDMFEKRVPADADSE